MYEPSRNIISFFISGFQHYDGALVVRKMNPGDVLALEAQPDNPYDHDAVAIKRKDVMLGYVPAKDNALLSLMIHYGHADAFECRVL